MIGLFPTCIIDLDSFIQQIFVGNLSCSALAVCQFLVLKNLVISSFPRSQFQILLSVQLLCPGVQSEQEFLSIHLGNFFLEREFGSSAQVPWTRKFSLSLSLSFLCQFVALLSPIMISRSLHVFSCYALSLSVRRSEICLLNHLANGLVDVCWAAQSLQLLSTYYGNPAGQIKKATCLLVILGLLCSASGGAPYWTF